MCGVFCLFFAFLFVDKVVCNPVSNTNFNKNIREYAVEETVDNTTEVRTLQKEDVGRYANLVQSRNPIRFKNTTEVRTLQKEDVGRYANLVQSRNPIRFKEVPDNIISSSSHGRGLLHHEYTGYGHDYDDTPHYGHDFHGHDDHPHHYDSDHLYPGHHHVGYGYHHHKYHDHSLEAKTVLWPLAGLALLGAAAALVTNPVLLQLGVVSGRKRRHAEEVSSPELNEDTLKDWKRNVKRNDKDDYESNLMINEDDSLNDELKSDREGMFKKAVRDVSGISVRKVYPVYSKVTVDAQKYNSENYDDRFMPIQLKTKSN